jgi:hypothetical protein
MRLVACHSFFRSPILFGLIDGARGRGPRPPDYAPMRNLWGYKLLVRTSENFLVAMARECKRYRDPNTGCGLNRRGFPREAREGARRLREFRNARGCREAAPLRREGKGRDQGWAKRFREAHQRRGFPREARRAVEAVTLVPQLSAALAGAAKLHPYGGPPPVGAARGAAPDSPFRPFGKFTMTKQAQGPLTCHLLRDGMALR